MNLVLSVIYPKGGLHVFFIQYSQEPISVIGYNFLLVCIFGNILFFDDTYFLPPLFWNIKLHKKRFSNISSEIHLTFLIVWTFYNSLPVFEKSKLFCIRWTMYSRIFSGFPTRYSQKPIRKSFLLSKWISKLDWVL